jgi:hypothetical protein
VEIRKITLQGQPAQKVHKTPSQQKAEYGSMCLLIPLYGECFRIEVQASLDIIGRPSLKNT